MLKILRNAAIFIGVLVFMFLMGIASLMRPDIPVERLLDTYTYPTSAFLDVDGMRIHYTAEGDGEPLLLIHGTFASLHTRDDWTTNLRSDFRVIRLDLPGFGLTGPQPDNDYSTRATLYILEELRRELAVEQWSIAGNSLGGGIALSYARHFPDRVNKLILLNAAAGRLPAAPDTSKVAQAPAPAEQATISNDTSGRAATTATLRNAPSENSTSTQPAPQERPLALRALDNPRIRRTLTVLTPRAVIQQSLKEVYADENRIRRKWFNAISTYYAGKETAEAFLGRNAGATTDRSHLPALPEPLELHQLPHPVLIMWGEQDRWIRVELGRRLHAAMPGSQFIVYPDAGHVPMEELPDKTSNDAMQFLHR